MGDRPSDAQSASSEDSVRVPPRLDSTRIKPGPGALPADAFDPLKHEDWEQFWYHIDQYYQPINQDDVRFLRAIPVNPYGGFRDPHLRLSASPERRKKEGKKGLPKLEGISKPLHKEKGVVLHKSKGEMSMGSINSSSTDDSTSAMRNTGEVDATIVAASLNSFPLTHRLVASLLDVGGTPAPSSVSMKGSRGGGGMDHSFYMGVGGEEEVRSYQVAFEERVRIELIEYGLIVEKEQDELQVVLRQEQWKLRDTKQMARIRKTALYTQIIGVELRAQAIKREVKKYQDQVEIAYLERMVRNMKKNKKSRSKFQKLLQRMFGHYKDKDKASDKMKKATESISNGRLLTNGEEKGRSSVKKKKKKGDMGPPAGSSVHMNGPRKGMS